MTGGFRWDGCLRKNRLPGYPGPSRIPVRFRRMIEHFGEYVRGSNMFQNAPGIRCLVPHPIPGEYTWIRGIQIPWPFFKPALESYDDDPEEVLRGLENGEGVPNETHPEMLLFPSLLFTRSVTINVPAPG
jgi:hypothetical protein